MNAVPLPVNHAPHAVTMVDNGRFEVMERIASGSFKSVWAARDRLRGQFVALSILHEAPADDPDAELRFQREAHILAQLGKGLPPELQPLAHRIISLIDAGYLNDAPPFRGAFITTPFKPGITLKQLLKARGAMPWQEAIDILVGVMEALQVCHTATEHRGPVIHRDLKPDNIIIGPNGQITVLDFGVSKLVMGEDWPEQSATVGTARYMAPEQFEAHGIVRPQSDLYAAGVLFHELITGEPPWSVKNLGQILSLMCDRQDGEEPPLYHLEASSCPDALEELIRRMLALNPEDRPASAEWVRDRLLTISDAEPTWVPPPAIDVSDLLLPPSNPPPAPCEPPVCAPAPRTPRGSGLWTKTLTLLSTALVGLMAGWASSRLTPNDDGTPPTPGQPIVHTARWVPQNGPVAVERRLPTAVERPVHNSRHDLK